MKKTILTITGPSASGKSTLEQALCIKGSPFARVRSITTRPIRAGEVNGREYDFVNTDTFRAMETRGELLESNQFGPYLYGATVAAVQEIALFSKIAVLVIDPNGLAQIEHTAPDHGFHLVRVYISNPSQLRMRRLIDRFVTEIEQLELGGEAFQRKSQGFAERLALVVDVEGGWDEVARRDTLGARYDLRCWAFDPGCREAVIGRVSDLALAHAFGPNVRAFSTEVKRA